MLSGGSADQKCHYIAFHSTLGKVIKECRNLVREFNNMWLYFIKWSANMSVHEFAHVSHIYSDRVFDWRSVHVPNNVKTYILNELLE